MPVTNSSATKIDDRYHQCTASLDVCYSISEIPVTFFFHQFDCGAKKGDDGGFRSGSSDRSGGV